MEPTLRFGTQKAIDELAAELNLPNNSEMQDWSYEVAKSEDVEQYIFCYQQTADEDKKFVLMEMIIQAIEEQLDKMNFQKYCDIVEPILENDFKIHEYTVFYWTCADYTDNELSDCWKMTPLMRKIWHRKSKIQKTIE